MIISLFDRSYKLHLEYSSGYENFFNDPIVASSRSTFCRTDFNNDGNQTFFPTKSSLVVNGEVH